MTQQLPPGWYPDPYGAPQPRYWDGQQWGPSAPPPPMPPLSQIQPTLPPLPTKKKKNRGWAALAVVGVTLLVIVIGGHDNKHAAAPVSAATPASPATMSGAPSARPATPRPPASVGQEVRDGQFAFTVTSVDRSKQAGDLSNQFEIVTAQGEFLNVHLTVANTGTRAQSFFATNQKLKIGNETFDANSSAALWTQSADVDINPGNSIHAVVSFDVSPGSSGGTLEVHDSALSFGMPIALP